MLAERGYLTYVNPDYLYNTYLRVYRYNKTVKAYDFGYGVKYVANTTVWVRPNNVCTQKFARASF